MVNHNIVAGPLSKVRLSIKLLPESDYSVIDQIIDFVFIYGIGSAGITPFEKMLFAKPVGYNKCLTIKSDQIHSFFGHLGCAVAEAVKVRLPWRLDVTVAGIEKAQSREVVKAMAQLSNCGRGCDCGCGY
ncbi:MAG: hypothetical protein GY874_02405 [Desulfobacteraceae bacterium]|nr:hypothetical protein [Desulfobacteraceae bacterium]